MVFSSVVFLFFFLPAVWTAYHLSPRKARNGLLLLASLLFYAWGEKAHPTVVPLLICLNYVLGLTLIAAGQRTTANRDECPTAVPSQRGVPSGAPKAHWVLGLGVLLNLLVLVYFKYSHFLLANFNVIRGWFALQPFDAERATVPLGISFVIFHCLSYLIDTYQSKPQRQENLLRFSLYIMLFPKLLAGPIVKYRDAETQLPDHPVTPRDFLHGVARFVVGFSKKLLIANPVAAVSDRIFAIPQAAMTADIAWLGILCFTLQIYFDFSGYTDMAIGLGRTFGFRFPENFDYPYVARSIQDFWRRWHITLSSWFRDYLYIPLGGSRRRPARTYANLMAVFLLCGLWHGAGWNFVVWGAWYGFFLILERRTFGRWLRRCRPPIQHAYSLLVIAIGWVFFRADDLLHACRYLAAMGGLQEVVPGEYPLSMFIDNEVLLSLWIGCAASTPVWPAAQRAALERIGSARQGGWVLRTGFSTVQALLLTALFFLSCMAMAGTTHSPFIYFKF